MKRRKKPTRGRERRPPPARSDRIEALVEQAIVDAYGESEQRTGFLTMLDEDLAVPFETEVLGVRATVERIDLGAQDEIVAICRRGTHVQAIPILDLPLPTRACRRFVLGGRTE